MQMTEDLRVMRTKKAIKTAFVDLVNEKGFANVTIKEIAERAIINRQTFYNYYQDKYDLTEQLSAELLATFETLINHRVSDIQTRDHSIPLLSDFCKSDEFSTILDSRNTILALLSIQYDQNSFKNRLQSLFIRIIQEKSPIEFTNLDISIIGNFYVDMINFIAKNNVKPTKRDLAELRKLITLIIQ